MLMILILCLLISLLVYCDRLAITNNLKDMNVKQLADDSTILTETALQDSDSLIKFQHAVEARAYARAALLFTSSDSIYKRFGHEMDKNKKKIEDIILSSLRKYSRDMNSVQVGQVN